MGNAHLNALLEAKDSMTFHSKIFPLVPTSDSTARVESEKLCNLWLPLVRSIAIRSQVLAYVCRVLLYPEEICVTNQSWASGGASIPWTLTYRLTTWTAQEVCII